MDKELFSRVLRQGAVVRGNSFSLHYQALSPKEKSRIAVVVSKRVARTATARNQLKRRGREFLRNHLSQGGTPYAVILRLTPTAASRTHAQFREELGVLLYSRGIATAETKR